MSTVDVQLSFSRARNIVGGATGSFPYQSANSSTVFVPIGANSTVLQSNGTTATWVALSGLTAGVASQISTVQRTTDATHFLTFVDANNASATAESLYTTSSVTVNPSTGKVDILSNLASTSTNTGALVVTGGIGLNGSIFSGGSATIAGGTLNIGSANMITVTSVDGVISRSNGQIQIIGGGPQSTRNNIIVGNGTGITLYGGTGTGGNQIKLDGGDYNVLVSQTTASVSTTTGALVVNGGVGIGRDLWVGAGVYATTKSFLIPHPTKPGMKLRYGSLEGPENGVYVRGKLTNNNTIELPDYWIKLVDPESITVNLTPIGRHQNLYVETIAENKVIIGNSNLLNKDINCFYTVFAERKDVDKLQVEIY